MNEAITELLTRGVEAIIEKNHLEQALNSKKKLRIKLGIDPTSPNIHIGRAVVLWKLRQFQELGHTAIFIVGDFTGLVGDTSDKESERPMLTENQVKKNMKTYFDQAFKILDKEKTEVYYNSKWLKKLGFLEIVKMASLFGLREFEAREIIAKRMKAGTRVSFQELLYPLMQGYDSVEVRADVELGGSDQLFNLLTGRDIQGLYKQSPQDILMTTLMEGTDGRKMSSSWGNVINITEESGNMFGKTMSISDELIKKYFVLATRVPLTEVDEILKLPNPRDQKLRLAYEITKLYHGALKAKAAQDTFINTFQKKELDPISIPKKQVDAGTYKLSELLVFSGLVSSKSEARRLFDQKGIKLATIPNSETLKDKVFTTKSTNDISVAIDNKTSYIIQVGKHKFIRLI